MPVKLLVAIRNLRYHMKRGRHLSREMDLRNQIDLNLVFTEFAGALEGDQECNYSFFSICYPELPMLIPKL